MTKKSAARLARDAVKKELENTCIWDDVKTISQNCYALLLNHVSINQFMKDTALMSYVDDVSLLSKNIKVLASDLTAMTNELNALKALHDHKSGKAETPDEHIEAIELHEKYLMWIQRHDNVVMPIATHIIEQIQSAIDRKAAAHAQDQQQKDLSDPNVVSDAVVKETIH